MAKTIEHSPPWSKIGSVPPKDADNKYSFYFWSILKVLLVCLLPVFQAAMMAEYK